MKNYRFACLLLLILPFSRLHAQLWKQYMDSARLYNEQQKIGQAKLFGEKAREELSKDSAGTKTYATTCYNLGTLYYMAGENTKAKLSLLEAIQLRKKLLGKNHKDYDASCNNLANIYADEGQYKLAESLYLEVKCIREQQLGKQHLDYARSCSNLALLYFNMGLYQKAEALFLEANAVYEKASDKDQDYYARSCNNLGVLYQAMGLYKKAEQLYQEAINIQEKLLGKQHNNYFNSCSNLASFYFDMQQYEKAESLQLEIKQGCEKVFGKQHPLYASCCNDLAHTYVYMNQYEKAEPLYLEARQICKTVLGKQSPDYARNCSNLAVLYLYMGRTKEAVSLQLEAKEIRAGLLGKQHDEYGVSCEALGNAYRLAAQPLRAEKEYEEAFAVRLHNLYAVFQFTSDKEKEAYVKNVLGEDDQILSFYLSAHTHAGLPYSIALFHRNLILSSAASLKKEIFSANDPLLQNRYSEWVETRKQLADLYAQPIEDRGAGIPALEEKAAALEKELAWRSAVFAKQVEKPDWKKIQRRLKPEEAAIEFVSSFLYDGLRVTDTVQYAAILLKKNGPPVMIPLCREKQLNQLLASSDHATTVGRIEHLYSAAGTEKKAAGPSLYELVWKPLEPALHGIKTIYFAPAYSLHTVSFAALPINGTTVLSDKYKLIQLATTASAGEPMQQGITAADKIQLYGDISYSADTARLKDIASAYRSESRTNRSLPEELLRGGMWNELPATRREIDEIVASSGPHQQHITALSGVYATEESLKNLDGNASPAILHIATHGFFFADPATHNQAETGRAFKSSDDPLMRAGLLFAGANNAWQNRPVKGIDDGILTAYEVASLYLPHTKLVVLSACETGLGEIRSSEGVYGLQRAFKIAGVQSLIMSLWKVPDQDTAEFMEVFYKKLFSGRSTTEAFRQAQQAMKAKYRNKPFRWAAWILLS